MAKNKNYDEICAYCENAESLFDPDCMLCRRNGIVSKAYKCRHFVYDPLKREPPRAISAPKLEFIDID